MGEVKGQGMRYNLKKVYDYLKEINLVEYLTDFYGLEFKSSGSNYFAVCPIHSDSDASFNITKDKEAVYYCFGCGRGGNIINFVEEVADLNRIEAILKIFDDLEIDKMQFIDSQASGYNIESTKVFC
jgi:DNA primase